MGASLGFYGYGAGLYHGALWLTGSKMSHGTRIKDPSQLIGIKQLTLFL